MLEIVISQKRLDLGLHSKIDLNEYISNKITDDNDIIDIMKKLALFLSGKNFTNKNPSANPSKLK